VDNLTDFGARPVRQPVVEDRPVITAAGVSPGLDPGASLVERMGGRPLVEAALLVTE
jgi:transcriptional regulator GlxA family with amidase domain